jgi:hypothetical protein
MATVVKYAFAAGVIGLIPFSFPLLMLLEVVMVYHLSVIHKRPFYIGELSIICGALLSFGFFLHVIFGIILDFLGPVGWVAKAGVAFVVVIGFGSLVNWYYQMENKKQSSQ